MSLRSCGLRRYSMTTNQEAIIRLFKIMNRYIGNLVPDTRRLSALSRARGAQHDQ
jgi:hypothetical protein